ncbi:MAG TPA: BMP family ABC transporter substrate-binding protein [Caldilineae bacterium]|nr:BMP family ABC transporter substrate-binding protein [Caldilineae bacterium]
MRKHYWLLLSALLIAALTLAACGGAATEAPKAEPTQAQEALPATEAPQAQPTQPKAEEKPAMPEGETFRVAVVLPSTVTDLAWSQALMDSLKRIQAEMGGEAKMEIAYTENMWNVTDAAAAIRDYADNGYNLVIAHGTQYGTSLFEIASDYPDTSFAWGTATDTGKDKGIENVFAYEARAEQGGFVLGVLAAKLSKSSVLGVVGPVEAGDAKLYIDGFAAGAAYANPDVKVNISYTGSFGDTALAAEAANTHIAAGADVLTGSAQQVVGAIGVAKDKGILWIGTQSDQSSLAPDIVVASQVYNWDGPFKDMIAKHMAGVMGGEVYALSLENGGLVMKYADWADKDAVAAAEQVKQMIIDGKLNVMDAIEGKEVPAMEEGQAEEGMETGAAAFAYPESLDPVRIAMVLPSTITDLAWSQSLYDSVKDLQDHYGADVIDVAYTENMWNVTDAAAAIRDYADAGYDIVIAHGAQYGASLFEIAPDYPDTSFAWGTTTNTGEEEGVTNVFAYEPRADEGGYVLGVIAAMLTKSGIVGVVGPVDAGDAKLHVDGFIAGVHAAKPDVQVNISFTGSFGDTALAAEAANTHIAAGADVLTGSAQQVVGAIGVCREKNVPWLGIQADQSSVAPDIVMATDLYDWRPTILKMIEYRSQGVLGGEVLQLTLANGGQRMVYHENLPAEIVNAAKAAEKGLIEGSIEIKAEPR